MWLAGKGLTEKEQFICVGNASLLLAYVVCSY